MRKEEGKIFLFEDLNVGVCYGNEQIVKLWIKIVIDVTAFKRDGSLWLWLFAFLVSFYVISIPDVLQTALVVSAVTIALGIAILKTDKNFQFSTLTFLMGGLWAVAAISVITSEVKFVSLTFFFFWSTLPLSFLTFSKMDGEKLFKPVRMILLALGASSLVQFFAMPERLLSGGAHWPFADCNSLGALLAVGSLLFWGEVLKAEEQGKKDFQDLATALFLFAAVMTTNGRAVFLAFIITFIVMNLIAKPSSLKMIWVFLSGAVALLFVMVPSDLSVYHWFGEGGKAVESFLSTPVDKPNDLSSARFLIWSAAWQIFLDHPITGTGIGTFFLYYPELRSPLDNSAGYMAHNDLLQFAAEMGGLAPLLAIAIAGLVGFGTLKVLKTAPNRLDVVIPFSVFMLLAGHSLVNFNFYILPSLMLSGLVLAQWNRKAGTRQISIGGSKTLRESVTVFGVFIFLLPLWGVALSEYKVSDAMDKLAKEDIAGFGESLNLADRVGIGLNARAFMQAGLFAEVTGDTKKALTLFDKATSVNPRMEEPYVERSKLLMEKDREKALAEAWTAFRLNPSSIPARMQLADILEREGKKDEAYEILKGGLEGRMRSRNPAPYYQRVANTALGRGDIVISDRALKRLQRLSGKK